MTKKPVEKKVEIPKRWIWNVTCDQMPYLTWKDILYPDKVVENILRAVGQNPPYNCLIKIERVEAI